MRRSAAARRFAIMSQPAVTQAAKRTLIASVVAGEHAAHGCELLPPPPPLISTPSPRCSPSGYFVVSISLVFINKLLVTPGASIPGESTRRPPLGGLRAAAAPLTLPTLSPSAVVCDMVPVCGDGGNPGGVG